MRITTTKYFDKRLKKMPAKIQQTFKKRVVLFMTDSNCEILNTHKLHGKLQDLWSFNVSGDIRVVFDKSQKDVTLLVDIGSHSELYS